MKKILNFIGGEFQSAASGKFFDNLNPATGAVDSLVADSEAADVAKAVAAAKAAFPAWSALSTRERSQYLRAMAQKITEKLDELSIAESIDNGKPVSVARETDIPRSAFNFEFFADAITQFSSESYWTDQRALNVTDYGPLGVVACISPWNLPLYLLTWKLAPALAMGNTVVAKPSEVTPMTAFLLCQIAQEIGLPPGVLNIVHGTGPNVGAPLVAHQEVKAVSFTGSTATGRAIAKSIVGEFKKVSLEMGGKNPNLIFADCDFEKAISTTLRSSFANQGQICLCGSRILIEQSIFEKFKTALVERTKSLRQGDPLEAKTQQGALVSKAHMEKVLACLQRAKDEGGRILCGGKQAAVPEHLKNGYFIEPTIIEGLPGDCSTNQEEIFGPVVTIAPFSNESEAISLANGTRYGLAATVWTQDITRAHRVARKLESGIVWVNTWMLRDLRTPFGGVKESGLGREGGHEALRFFSEVKNICIDLGSEV